MNFDSARVQIDTILANYAQAKHASGQSVLPSNLTAGKVYEAWALCRVLERLRAEEGYDVVLHESTKVLLKSSPGPINRGYSHFELRHPARESLEVWTDVEFTAMSARNRHTHRPCDYHELDVVVVPAGTTGRPGHAAVRIGVECKNTGYTKGLLRSLLGVRRELSLLQHDVRTGFSRWPRALVDADPPSCLICFSTDPLVDSYRDPALFYGVDLVYEPLP